MKIRGVGGHTSPLRPPPRISIDNSAQDIQQFLK